MLTLLTYVLDQAVEIFLRRDKMDTESWDPDVIVDYGDGDGGGADFEHADPPNSPSSEEVRGEAIKDEDDDPNLLSILEPGESDVQFAAKNDNNHAVTGDQDVHFDDSHRSRDCGRRYRSDDRRGGRSNTRVSFCRIPRKNERRSSRRSPSPLRSRDTRGKKKTTANVQHISLKPVSKGG